MNLPPVPDGVTAVVGVRLFKNRDRTEGRVDAPVVVKDGQRYVDTLVLPEGRWWVMVDARKGADQYVYPLTDPWDLPEDERLVISPEVLASRLGIALPLDERKRSVLTEALLDAQADVQAYLGRDSLRPIVRAQGGLWPLGDRWSLDTDEEIIRVLSAVPEVDLDGRQVGTFTVTWLGGIDVSDPALRPVMRYFVAHAENQPAVLDLWRSSTGAKGAMKSVSTSGQSASWEVASRGGGGAAGSGAPGALPAASSMDRWRLAGRRVHQGATQFGRRYP